MKTIIIIQARMTSTRLPGKVLKKVLGKPLLEIQLERLKAVNNTDQIVVATTINNTDEPIVNLCQKLSIPIYRGSEEDVLERYYLAAKINDADVIVRITSDCPIIDPVIVEQITENYLTNINNIDYLSNSLTRTYPRGMDTEVFSFKVLETAYYEAIDNAEREHVTPFIYGHPERFRLDNYRYHKDDSHHRWTVDTVEDFELIKRIVETLYLKNPLFTLEDTLQLLEQNPEWFEINKNIEQKKLK